MSGGVEKTETVGALILAESSHRRQGAEDRDMFVPMAHILGSTVIKRQIRTLKKAGITRILVVARPEHVILERHLAHLAVGLCFCGEEPVRQGLCRLAECSQVILVPGDLPFFQPETLDLLLEAEGEIKIPFLDGQRGGLAVLDAEGWKALPEDKREDRRTETLRLSAERKETRVSVRDEGVTLFLREPEDIRRLEEYARRQKETRELNFQMKLMLGKQEDFFGPGIADFLVRIGQTGSILAACQEMHMSYSKGWKLVNKVEEELGFPFLIRRNGGKGGGSSTLTPEGEAFIRRYYAFSQDLNRMAENFFEQYFGDFL